VNVRLRTWPYTPWRKLYVITCQVIRTTVNNILYLVLAVLPAETMNSTVFWVETQEILRRFGGTSSGSKSSLARNQQKQATSPASNNENIKPDIRSRDLPRTKQGRRRYIFGSTKPYRVKQKLYLHFPC
jgi:hypothetical protein